MARQRTDGLIPEALAVEHLISDNGDQTLKPLTSAVTASSGVAVGEIAFDEDRAREQHANGKPVVLVRRDAETSPGSSGSPKAAIQAAWRRVWMALFKLQVFK